MPTGYTSGLYDGEQPFEEFVWQVARGFGALVTLRDEQNAPIPEEFEPRTTYHDEKIVAAQELLRSLDDMSVAEATAQARVEYEAEVQRRQDDQARRNAIRERYEAALEKAHAWEPPTADHVELKKTMCEQLVKAIEFDCTGYERPAPALLDAQVWVDEKRRQAEKDIADHCGERAKEVERAAQRTAWVKALRESLRSEVAA